MRSWGSSRQILAQRSGGWNVRQPEAPVRGGVRLQDRGGVQGGAKQIDQWVKQYKDHAEFGYIFRENARDVLNKQNPESVKKTLAYLASLVV